MKKEFSLDRAIEMPPIESIRCHKINDVIVRLLPERPTWIVLSKDEDQVFKHICQGAPPRKALSSFGRDITSRLLSKLEHAKFYKKDYSVERRLPLLLTLDLTNKCNLKCKHCYADAGIALRNELETSDWVRIIDDFSEMSENAEVTLTGGEPTVHPDFWHIAEYIKKKCHRLVVFTNGTTMTNEQLKVRLAELADVIQLSLDGLKQTTNDNLRGTNVWERVHDLFNSVYDKQVQIRLSICLTTTNKDEISANMERFMTEIDPMKKIGVMFSPTLTAGRNSEGKYTLDYPDVQNLIGKQLLKLWEAGWRRPNTFQRNERFQRCGIGGTIVVGSNGNLHACTFAPSTGNIRKDSLLKWHTNELEQLRRFSVDSHPVCSKCDLRYICRGGCWINDATHPCGASADLCDQRNKMFFFNKIVDESLAVFPDSYVPTIN